MLRIKQHIKLHKCYYIMITILLSLLIILNILAQFPKICDFYTDFLFRYISMPYTALSKLLPFSFGELLILLGILLTLLFLISFLCFCIDVLLQKIRHRKRNARFLPVYTRIYTLILLIVGLIMTLNCSLPYGCSRYTLLTNQRGEFVDANQKPTLEETRILRNYLVETCNTLAQEMTRDDKGYVTVPGYSEESGHEAALLLSMNSVKKRAGSDTRYSGVITHPKFLVASYLMYETNMLGYYFPFSMEANLSKYINTVNLPATACHELAHTVGYMFEDEANFQSFLSCTGSDDLLIQYSGYLEVLRYVNNDFYASVDPEEYFAETPISALVSFDLAYYTEDTVTALSAVEEQLRVNKETLTNVRQGFTDSYLKYYRATENYDEVTKLLLIYYRGILY